jgi:CBS domain-containing protein
MRVSDMMQPDVRTIERNQLLRDAVLELADAHVTALAVVDASGQLKGVLSTADVLQAQAETAEEDWAERTISDVMSPVPVTISPEATAQEAAQVMLYRDVHRVFVIDDGRLVGVISQTDLVRAMGAGKLGG